MYYFARVTDTVVGLVTLLLLVRFLLEFFGAHPRSAFVSWVYSLTMPLMAPFAGIFPIWNIEGFVIDIPVLVAMVTYGFLGWALIGTLNVFMPALPRTREQM